MTRSSPGTPGIPPAPNCPQPPRHGIRTPVKRSWPSHERGSRYYATSLLAGAILLLLVVEVGYYQRHPMRRADLQVQPPRMRINLNTADRHQLQLLPGIGPTLAQAIIAYRQQHGPFQRPADLEAVSKIGPVIRAGVEPWIRFDPR